MSGSVISGSNIMKLERLADEMKLGQILKEAAS